MFADDAVALCHNQDVKHCLQIVENWAQKTNMKIKKKKICDYEPRPQIHLSGTVSEWLPIRKELQISWDDHDYSIAESKTTHN